MLREEKVSDSVLAHTKAVAEYAVELAGRAEAKGHVVDVELVKIGALLHDIGRSKTHKVSHGIEGRNILQRHNVDERLCRIACNHVGAGIGKGEAVRLGLPAEDMIPETIEEKIICYADKLAFGKRIGSEEEVLERFGEELGKGSPALGRLRQLFAEMRELV